MTMPAEEARTETAAKGSIPRVEYDKIVLPNGLQLILHVDRKLPVVHVNQWYHVGSKNERRGRTGFAHLFEHIMFEGSLNASHDYFTYVERAGANLREGGVNGTTDFDRTNYFATVPSGNLELLLWVESDRLATLADALTLEKLDNQREVVRNEKRQSHENQPYGRAFTLITENLHPADHPYSWDVIGSHEDLMAASLEDVREFFRRYYVPNNLSLTVAGEFDPDEVRHLVEKFYGSVAAGPGLDRMRRYIPRLAGEKIVEAGDRVPQERVYMVWPAPEYFGGGQAELDIAASILSDGLSSRLNRVLVYDRQLCTEVGAFNQSLEISGSFIVVATARPGAPLREIEAIISEEIRRVASGGVSREELDRAKTKWEYAFVSGLERIGGFGGKADMLNQYNVYLGNPGLFAADVERYRKATAEDVQRAVGEWITTDRRLLVRIHPELSDRAPASVDLDRSAQPALGHDHPFVAPVVKSSRLDNGMEIFVVERRDLPKVAVSLVTRAGSVLDPKGKEGTASLVASTIASGTATRSALEIEDALGDLGTSIDGMADYELSMLSFDVLSRNLEATLEIVSDVVRNAAFPASDFEREKARHLDQLEQLANNPGALAARIRPILGYGLEHPYGRPVSGLPSSVRSLTAEDLRAFHLEFWKPGSSALVFAGDIDLDEAVSLASGAFGAWSGGAAPEVDIPEPKPAETGKVYLVERQGAPQTIVSQILPGPRRSVEDFYAFRLVDAIWGGGGFGTRLNLNLREDKGYTYGVFSNVSAHSSAGLWWASGGVQTDKTTESLVEFVSELRAIAGGNPVTEAEVENARLTRVRGYAQGFESLSRIAGRVAGLWVNRLPMSELQREVDVTANLTADEVRGTASKYVRQEEVIYLLVGDLATIKGPVGAMPLGELVVLDLEGRPVD